MLETFPPIRTMFFEPGEAEVDVESEEDEEENSEEEDPPFEGEKAIS